MNPWPDAYTEPPDARAARDALRRLDGLELEHLRWNQDARTVGYYLHHLTEELSGVQAVCDEQAAELARRDVCEGCQ